jgi:hypothetical protein
LPLKLPSEVVMVVLQAIVQGVYDRGGYVLRIDCQQVLVAVDRLIVEADRFGLEGARAIGW